MGAGAWGGLEGGNGRNDVIDFSFKINKRKEVGSREMKIERERERQRGRERKIGSFKA